MSGIKTDGFSSRMRRETGGDISTTQRRNASGDSKRNSDTDTSVESKSLTIRRENNNGRDRNGLCLQNSGSNVQKVRQQTARTEGPGRRIAHRDVPCGVHLRKPDSEEIHAEQGDPLLEQCGSAKEVMEMLIHKTMKMPTSCLSCWISPTCEVWVREKSKHKGYDDRLDECPLEEVKHGHWLRGQAPDGVWCIVCSNCMNGYDEEEPKMLEWLNTYFKFCPHCGAKMDEVDDEQQE